MMPEASQRLVSSVNRILGFLKKSRNAPLLLEIVSPLPNLNLHSTLKDTEAQIRRRCLKDFQDLPLFRFTSPTVSNDLVRALYPAGTGLKQLKSAPITKSQVNHSVLYKCYTALPEPGVGHLQIDNFEEFMAQMFNNRVFSRPNLLSSSTFHLYDELFLLKQYTNAIQYRKDHLTKLFHITRDMEDANIPLSDYERRQMVYMMFYKDRPDILRNIESFRSHSPKRSIQPQLDAIVPSFSWETYRELVKLNASSMNDIEYLNTLLFCALRHSNWKAEKDILSRIKSTEFSRDTFKILLDNHGMHRRHNSFETHLKALSQNHLHLLDSKLLDIILRSLVELGYADLCSVLISPFLMHDDKSLKTDDYFLKQLTYSDRKKYSAYLRGYDAMPDKLQMKIIPTMNTAAPLLCHYCASGAPFEDIMNLLYTIENEWGLPLSSLMFRYIFHAFTTLNYGCEELEFATMKLIEQHDQYNASDSWIKERFNETSFPANANQVLLDIISSNTPKHHGANEGAFLKLSNGLMRLVFLAYQSVYRSDPKKRVKISRIEESLWIRLKMIESQSAAQFHDELQPADLYGREEKVYLKKVSLLELLDI